MNFKFTVTPIVISAPTEEEAWDELFHEYELNPDNVDIEIECIGDE